MFSNCGRNSRLLQRAKCCLARINEYVGDTSSFSLLDIAISVAKRDAQSFRQELANCCLP
jgi:hypothetical protein